MNVESADGRLSGIAAAIAVPGRSRMLCALIDGRARTATELAAIAGVGSSTASAHLSQLLERHLLAVDVRGRHRYYTLRDKRVAAALEALMVISGDTAAEFEASTPIELRAARTCYDHLAGTVAVALRERLVERGWIARATKTGDYALRAAGERELSALGVDLQAVRSRRRRFAYACLDWSERKPHVGGALGAALLDLALHRRWFEREDEGRQLTFTRAGRSEFAKRFGVTI